MACMSDAPPTTNRLARFSIPTIVVGLVVATLVALWAVQVDFDAPQLVGRRETDVGTNTGAAIVRLTMWVSALGTLTMLLISSVMHPAGVAGSRRERHGLDDRSQRAVAVARAFGLMWFLSSVAGIVVVTATDARQPAPYVMGALGDNLGSNQSAQLWFLQAILVFFVTLICGLSRTVGGISAALYLGVFALMPQGVAGAVSVGLHHDLASDAMILALLMAGIWWPLGLATALSGGGRGESTRLRRHRWFSLPASLVVLAATWMIGWQGLAGESMTDSPYGWVRLGLLATTGMLVLLALLRVVVRTEAMSRCTLPLEVLAIMLTLGAMVASESLTPPRFSVPQDSQINLLGYTVEQSPNFWTLVAPGRPNLLLVTVSAVAILGYLSGVLLLRRRGDRWPIHRTVLWVVGWLVILGVTATGVWVYGAAAFSLSLIHI